MCPDRWRHTCRRYRLGTFLLMAQLDKLGPGTRPELLGCVPAPATFELGGNGMQKGFIAEKIEMMPDIGFGSEVFPFGTATWAQKAGVVVAGDSDIQTLLFVIKGHMADPPGGGDAQGR